MSTAALRPPSRVGPLDGLRGLAILAVVFHNTVEAVTGAPDAVARVLTLFAGPGWIGVQLFFALSGFLIVGELLDHQGAKNYLRAFYARRALRILPLYFATLILVLTVIAVFPLPAVATYLREQGWQLCLFLNNYSRPPPSGFGHFWSLAVEVQFYALVPWIVWRTRAPRLAATCLSIAVGVFVLRTACALAGTSAWTMYSGTIFRLDALALGAAGACLVRIESTAAFLRRHSAAGFLLAGFVLLFGATWTHSYDYSHLPGQTYGYTLAAISCALVVAFAGAPYAASEVQPPWIRWLSFTPLRLAGRYSFGIYLFHNLLNHLVGVPLVRHFFRTPIPGGTVAAYSAAVFIASLIPAVLSFEFFESRFLRLKPSFQPPPSQVDAGREIASAQMPVAGRAIASSGPTSARQR